MKLTLDLDTLLDAPVVVHPPGAGEGNWAGAPGAFRDPRDGRFYLTYRLRRPRGTDPETERGGESRIAVSDDGIAFRDLWSVRKTAYGTSSIEKSTLHRDGDGRWRYFTSFVHPDDQRWCVARYDAASPENLDPTSATVLFDARTLGLEGVKDPWILEDEGLYKMFLSVALPVAATSEQSHATQDIYNTGQCLSATALAVSDDLVDWKWQGVVMEPDHGWDAYCRRLNAVLPLDDGYLGFYDGARSHLENYEEKTGIARSTDLRVWEVHSPTGPAYASPHGRHGLRYFNACDADDGWLLYYEVAVPDGSHELRVRRVSKSDLAPE